MWRKYQIELLTLLTLSALAPAIGCRQDMHDQPKLQPLEPISFFADGKSSRHPVSGTVARGQLNSDLHLHEGKRVVEDKGKAPRTEIVETFPYEVTRSVLERGQERYDIYCSPCHAKTGNGDGMIVRRGFRQPPSLHDEKNRNAKVGHIYDVIRRGLGAMPAYGAQIPAEDRWAIVAYVRALQLTQNARIDDVPTSERANLRGATR